MRFLARIAIEDPGRSVKEHEIATEVFGRPESFDPRLDSTVRVQVARLRSKLELYYAGEGKRDSLVVEIPKGSYHLLFRTAVPAAGGSGQVEPEGPEAGDRPRWRQRRRDVITLVAGAVAAGALAVSLVALWRDASGGAPLKTKSSSEPPAVSAFWKPFLAAGDPPLVVFSNAEFVGRPESGLRYFDPSRDSRAAILDHYTGIGEVFAVNNLERLFARNGRSMRLKRSGLLSLDDVKKSNVIFIGSPSENLALRDLPGTKDFVFRVEKAGSRKGDLVIVNRRPHTGERGTFAASPGPPVTRDFAVLALLPGLVPTRHILVLAGITTLGTQAAAEFICDSRRMQVLLSRLRGLARGRGDPFEAVLAVEVSRGVPTQTKLVAIHLTGPDREVGP